VNMLNHLQYLIEKSLRGVLFYESLEFLKSFCQILLYTDPNL